MQVKVKRMLQSIKLVGRHLGEPEVFSLGYRKHLTGLVSERNFMLDLNGSARVGKQNIDVTSGRSNAAVEVDCLEDIFPGLVREADNVKGRQTNSVPLNDLQ